ncbi:MAG: amidohydrolase, partial [Deltaproteobacteria bacterium]
MMEETTMRPPAQDRHGETTPDLVITGGKVLCLSRSRAALLDADVAVSGGMITEVGDARSRPCVPGKGAETIDARGCLVMPGLVNAHSHAAMTLFRGFADDLPLREWLHDRIFPAEARFLDPDTVYWGALLGCLEMIASGTTCIADGYFFQDQTVRAVLKAGLRGLVAQGVIDFPAPGVPEPKENLAVAKRFVERWHGVSDRVIPGIFCHSPVTCGGPTMTGAWRICREFGVPLQIHLSETLAEAGDVTARTGKRPVHYLDELGIVGPGLIAAHAVHLDDGEMACLKEKG